MDHPVSRIAVFALAFAASAAATAQVTPPPLPIGSSIARPQAGLNEDERKRFVRAHHHKQHHKKDYTLDDSDPANADKLKEKSNPSASAGGNSNASKK